MTKASAIIGPLRERLDALERAARERCRCAAYGLPACALDLPEPECTCVFIDGDQYDSGVCELHDARSAWRKALAAHEPEAPGKAVTGEECKF